MWAPRPVVALALCLGMGCALGSIDNHVTTPCAPNSTRACDTGNGTGRQTCSADGTSWGGCGNLTACDPGYNLQGATCVANVCTPNASQACHADNGTGTAMCNSSGSALGGCGNLTSCDPGYNLQGATCVANVCTPNASQVCHAGNGTGTATCNISGSALGGCGNLTGCDPGFLLFGGACLQNTFIASYFDNMSLSGSPVVTRNDAAVNFRFGFGDPGIAGSPDPAIPANGWSARWLGDWSFPVSTTYRFYATTDDGVRVWLDGNLIIDKWLDQGETTYVADVAVGAGVHAVQVEYYQNSGAAMVVVSWALRPDALLAAEKSGACTADGLVWNGPAELFETGGMPHQDDFTAMIARSNCHLLNRSIETWFSPPNFSAVASRMSTLASLSGGKPFIHSLNIAEALLPGVTATWHDPLSNQDLSVASMCQPAYGPGGTLNQYGLGGSCVPSYFSPTYQQYLRAITQQALDVGAQDFLFGGMNLPDTKVLLVDDAGVMLPGLAAVDSTVTSAPIYPQLFARLRAYAVSKGVAITIGCQMGGDYGFNWAGDSHLKLCDYKYSPLLTSNVDSPSWTPTDWDNPQNASWGLADWNNSGITSQTSVLADYEWWGPTDDPSLFIKQAKPERAAFTFRATQLLRNAGQALLLPFSEPVNVTPANQCAALPSYPDNSNTMYSPSAQFCGDEDVFNQALANSPSFIYAEQSHVPVGGHTIIRWWTPTPNTCTVYDGPYGFWLSSDYGDTATYFPLANGGLTSTQVFTLKCPDGSQASTTVFVP